MNRFADVTCRQTTSLLAASARRLGQTVFVAEFTSVSAKTRGNSVELSLFGALLSPKTCTSDRVPDAIASGQHDHVALRAGDVVLIRTNPGRDSSRRELHESFLELMMIAEELGIKVVNRPANLLRFASKSSLLMIDQHIRPEMLVTNDIQDVMDFVNAAPFDCVIKPSFGSRGISVLRASKDQNDLPTRIADTFSNRQIVAQHFVAAHHPGDRRVVVFDGTILEWEGGIAGMERHPAAGDFRANLHAGGSAHRLVLNAAERKAADRAAQLLFSYGIRLAGVDMIGDRIIEFNVFSTGGLYDGNRFAGTDFSETIMRRLLQPSG